MHKNVVHCCIHSIGKYCASITYSTCHKLSRPKRLMLGQPRYNVGYALRCQSYCTDENKVVTSSVDKNAQKELEEFLKDPKNEAEYKALQMEIELLRYSTYRVPDNVRARDWRILFNLSTKSKRRKYLEYVWRLEKLDEKRRDKSKKKSSEVIRTPMIKMDGNEMEYGLHKNSLFLRIYESTMNNSYNHKLIQAIMYEPIVVFDLGFTKYMTMQENSNCAKQLLLSFSENRVHKDPMNLYFCNTDKSSYLMEILQRFIPPLYNHDFPLNITSQSYLDIFDKDRIVYLTPHCNQDMDKYDPNLIYVIGALVDKTNPKPFTLAKAKKEGIRMARFPLSRHLSWGSGSGKSLTLNQSLKILLDLRVTRSWKTALETNVPPRKLKHARINAMQRKLSNLEKKNSEYIDENAIFSDMNVTSSKY